MDAFVTVIKKDPRIRFKMNDVLDIYNRLPYKYQSKIGYDTLIQNGILKELINEMSGTITDIDSELKMKISGIEDSESKKLFIIEYVYNS